MFGPLPKDNTTLFESIGNLLDIQYEQIKMLRADVQRLEQKLAWHESVTHGSSSNGDAWGDAQGFAKPRPSPDGHGF